MTERPMGEYTKIVEEILAPEWSDEVISESKEEEVQKVSFEDAENALFESYVRAEDLEGEKITSVKMAVSESEDGTVKLFVECEEHDYDFDVPSDYVGMVSAVLESIETLDEELLEDVLTYVKSSKEDKIKRLEEE